MKFPTGEDDKGEGEVKDPYLIGETKVTCELWNKVQKWAENKDRGNNIYNFSTPGHGSCNSAGAPYKTCDHEAYGFAAAQALDWNDAMVWTNALTEWYNANNGTNYTCAYYTDDKYIRLL